jgi:hypothetical protein
VWFGGRLEPGVIGFGLGNFLVLEPIPPGRDLLTNRSSPDVICRIVRMRDGGCDLRLSVFTQGYPWRVIEDPVAMAFFNDWATAVADELALGAA